jgi:ferredoxin
MRYAYPDARDTANMVRSMLMTYMEAGGTDPVILFASAEDASELPETPSHVLLVAVEELASVGHEIWLSALAWGARCVLLVDRGSVPRKAAAALSGQVETCHALLEGIGLGHEALKLIADRDLPAACEPSLVLAESATYSANVDKRQLASLAIDHLASFAADRPDIVPLPESAPYGAVQVDQERCTLCMGCTSVCPAKALSAGDEVPRLDFFESNCVQCGICANACPEQAITLTPRYQLNAEARRRPVVLNEEPPFCCIECGKPFATRRVVDTILDKLAGHAMFASERAKRRLQMCEDCRVVDAVQDPDAMRHGLTLSPDATADQEH